MLTFTDSYELRKWLTSRAINIRNWDATYGHKSIQDLWAEIEAGESQLEDDPPTRIIGVVNIIIRNGNKILVESYQKRGQNQLRYRGYLPSEKIKPHESPIDAALRGLEEELQIQRTEVRVLSSTQNGREKIWESRSYPGLLTKYMVHAVKVEAERLPKEDFRTLETSKELEHYWTWVDEQSIHYADSQYDQSAS